MSDYLNENPDVLETNQLPTREEDDELNNYLSNGIQNKNGLERRKLLLKMDRSLESQVLKDVELLDRLLLLNSITESTSDEESDENLKSLTQSTHLIQDTIDPIDAQEIYDLTAYIQDPEHPLTLGQLSIVNLEDIQVHDTGNQKEMAEVVIHITPTITHCSLATLIGLGIRVRLERALPPRFRITILLKKGTHQSENQVNKQLNDKERVTAACENEQLLNVVSNMLSTCK
ncbi:hypothetical protein TBLA_0B01200 [Henningerozyma blattae CBS 6284]|uniref:Uncharacterized protein n=1 Tax=Henningerozyma blattae (strain ATCC 34711 / CBS 6284 / DSM 70876 / NBRC 10599 / NRRL Y-10934 / UCD 77-7) TaxID=1071380 RepID=I2GXW1_HENB6|nr:hypothetical protein TBLA_0B01200 [Tetrapisispora blattae CBS 6284]CCH58963.1 hypothetical protein TBLA_0B01200 [Tetrapisispora blattae CBS 6284]